jgi:hypothetical protein
MPSEVVRDGDLGFIGLNSRDNPSTLPAGTVSLSQNFRLDRGVATVRKGLQRKTSFALVGQTVYGSGCYLDTNGQEVFIVIVTDGLYSYNPQTEFISTKVNFPVGVTITTSDGCDVVHAVDRVFISRGFGYRPLMWNLSGSITELPASHPTAGHEFPNCTGLLYYSNRLIALGKYHSDTDVKRNRDTVCVSNYLDYQHWDALDAFSFNEGGNDEVVSVSPWTLNEFLVLMRNSIFYVNIGLGRYADGEQLGTTSFIKTLVTDIGCSAKRSVVLAGGGVFFLSDNGVYFLQPQPSSSDSMKLLTTADPISAPIDDVIQRINKNASKRSVATYWNNRYYLAVPLDASTDNNAILVYNFILKAWESVDVYPAGFDVASFLVGKKDNQRRLFAVDGDQGFFLMEQLEYDEYGPATGTPVLPFFLPATISTASFTPNTINGILETRRYTFNSIGDKRFSTSEVELSSNAGGQVRTSIDVYNPDVTTITDSLGFATTEDTTRRIPIRKIGSGIKLKFETLSLQRPSVRSAYIYAINQFKTNQSKK